ncbi:unnamed protein product [Acanthoscelides obtectus]|uniref:Uncharacterized protein n=1 Tax=Acanthoscelides obtectus TaxID=200917 RepID=A0A9P0MJ08_ACAOB|nr:unnamed protein product [Acanthoscelides obtectus]CAH2018846.1 unnamed protein product [Acanthoscelides obtectus]CAK1652188.1 hypothetical protein AOBTE_LOCUS17725 [Acanthoscelides obtectus]CAK1688729.1 hypothetical protein AOBTE_LOCUS36837 [Acanthoscelides obtectus]
MLLNCLLKSKLFL